MPNEAVPLPFSARQLFGVLVAGAGVVTTAFLGRHVLIRIATLYPDGPPPHPYWVPDHALLLYVMAPLAVIAMCLMLLTPGVLLLLAAGGEARAGAFLLKSFGAAFGLRVALHTAIKLVSDRPFGASAFMATEWALDAVLAMVLAWRVATRRPLRWPAGDAAGRRRLSWFVLITAVFVAMTVPAMFWHDLTPDGMEALNAGQSLVTQLAPMFGGSGLPSLGEGMIAMAFPMHWFTALLGSLEAAARLPMALYLPVLFGVLLELIELRAPRPLRPAEEGAIVVALSAFVVTMMYSASYDAYSADLSSLAGFETLTVLGMASVVLFLWRGETASLVGFTVLTYFARPTAVLLLLFLGLGALIVERAERRRLLMRLGLGLLVCVIVSILFEKLYLGSLSQGQHGGLEFTSNIRRLRYLTFTDVQRLLFAAVPAGLLPILAMAAWRRQDQWSRQLTVACVLYFLFFYVQAATALHYFAPVMVLPIVVLWRLAVRSDARWPAGAAAVTAAICVALSLPQRFVVRPVARHIGHATVYGFGNWNGDRASRRNAFTRRNRRQIYALFPIPTDRGRELMVSDLQVIYYSSRFPAHPDSANYFVLAAGGAPPRGATLIAADSIADVYVRDVARWRRERMEPPATDFRSPIYEIPRATLFPGLAAQQRRYQLDLGTLPILWRLF